MSKLQIALTSPTVWTIVGVFAFNGLTAIAPMLGGNVALVVNVILLALAGVLHTSHVQTAQGTNTQ